MGRTKRRRNTKKVLKSNFRIHHRLGCNEKIIELMQWLTRNGWEKERTLYPTEFPVTGRGLLTKSSLKKGDILVNIPCHLLITARTVRKSHIYEYLDKTVKYDGHEVLAFFLVWENHLKENSFWYPYINTLPLKLSTPLYWSKEPINLPTFIADEIRSLKMIMEEFHTNFMKHISCKSEVCRHCNLKIVDIFNLKDFIWAWCIINTRAVYIPPEKNLDNIYNTLALAPFLDLFNHVPNAKVEAMLLEHQNIYQVKTLVPVQKYHQVFIEYGSHSNLKLLIDYGFIVPNNHNDFIAISLEDIYEVIKERNQLSSILIPKEKYKFLKQHNLLMNPCITKEGLCWKTISIIYIFITNNLNLKLLECKVYSSTYSSDELKNIYSIGSKLVLNKINEFQLYITKFVCVETNQNTILLYLEECIRLLKYCLRNLHEKVEN